MTHKPRRECHRITLLRKAIRLFNSEFVSREQNKYNRRAWLKAVEALGDKWAVTQKVERKG